MLNKDKLTQNLIPTSGEQLASKRYLAMKARIFPWNWKVYLMLGKMSAFCSVLNRQSTDLQILWRLCLWMQMGKNEE